MAIQPTEGRNISNYARKIIAEKLIFERRQWELMRDNKHHPDVVELGSDLMNAYRGLMISITAVDLLDVNAASISTNLVNMTDSQLNFVYGLARYLITELTVEDFNALTDQLTYSIIQWSFGVAGSGVLSDDEDSRSDPVSEEAESIRGTLQGNIPYIVLILLTDLHHMTYVASADQCLGILSST